MCTSRMFLFVLATAFLVPMVAGCAGVSPRRSVSSSSLIESGTASYYHDRLHGRKTASGDVYDRDALTAAHRTLPFGTKVLVRNLGNGKAVRLTINDRGPFVDGRIVDVSYRAAQALGFLQAGLAEVSVQVVD